MGMDVIIQLINGVGFPIAVSIALFYQNGKQDERYDKQMEELTKVIENNTITLKELCLRLENTERSANNG
jgi:hypothetical protein